MTFFFCIGKRIYAKRKGAINSIEVIFNFLSMNNTSLHDKRIAEMSFASVYPHYINKIEKKAEQLLSCKR